MGLFILTTTKYYYLSLAKSAHENMKKEDKFWTKSQLLLLQIIFSNFELAQALLTKAF